MKTLFGLSGMAMLLVGFLGFMAESAHAQYLPPVIDDAFLSKPVPDFIYPEKQPELTPIQQNQNTQFIYRQYEDEFQLPAHGGMAEQYQIVITPVADQRPGAGPPRVMLPTAAEPQQISGMTAQTIYYFPPPAFPPPVPLTVYRPVVPQQPQLVPQFPQSGEGQAGDLQDWSPYNSNAMYGPPMITQPQYFGPPKQERGRRAKTNNPGVPGDPVVGPPTLVYPNGIVVRPKVYLPGQPFKNVVRAMTP